MKNKKVNTKRTTAGGSVALGFTAPKRAAALHENVPNKKKKRIGKKITAPHDRRDGGGGGGGGKRESTCGLNVRARKISKDLCRH